MNVIVKGQEIFSNECRIVLATGSIDWMEFKFYFSDDWTGFIKTAQFTQNGTTYNQLLENDACMLPSEITEGNFLLSVFGVLPNSAKRATTAHVVMNAIYPGFVSEGQSPIPPTPDLYNQLITQITNMFLEQDLTAALRADYLPNCTTEVTKNSAGAVTRIEHIDEDEATVRTDVFTYDENTVTEVRTMASGATLTLVYNLTALVVSTTEVSA